MENITKSIIAIGSIILFCNISNCQEKIQSIKNYCDLTNRHPGVLTVSLGQDELGTFGGHLEGYFRGDVLIKITRWNAHVSIWQQDYYFRDNRLVFATFSKRSPDYADSDINKMKSTYTDSYYFENNRIIKKEISGRRNRNDRRKTEKEALQKALEYKQLLISRGKTAANKSIANSGAGRWSNRQHIAINFGSGRRNSF